MNPQGTSKGEQYNLRWTNYLSNLSQILLDHHLSEKLVDVTLVCEGQYIRAHKLVLSACSMFFQVSRQSFVEYICNEITFLTGHV